MTTVFLIVSIVLSLALVGQVQPTVIPNFIFACSKWIRPPSVVIGNVQTSGVNITGVGLFLSSPSRILAEMTPGLWLIDQPGCQHLVSILLYWFINASSLPVLLLFSVNNPNYFSVDFQKIEAEVFIRNV